ncbi:DUF2271 domain-containing protein [Rheinheimera sp.]|uniref:DUF2271 domain-containing protein n=1 Tax=Rheinheimera sp. TaxID=1869214 RepID=UPI0027BB1BF0|nr:DUF2271 domain-containing protein [Rheinheimera sp.]
MKFAPLVLALLMASGAATAGSLNIQLELPKPEHGPYHRPYVAVWVEDAKEKPVRLIEIWREKPDWIKDLRRFWRKTGRADQPLVDARTGATKGPGQYQLSWDGMDDKGVAVAQGQYLLVVEAAREHGGRNLVKQAFTWDGSVVDINVKAGTEIGQIILTKGAN